MGITLSPECGNYFEEESEGGERKRERRPRKTGRPRKDKSESAPLKSRVREKVPTFEDFDQED